MRIRPAVPADTAALDALERTLFSPENYPVSRPMFYYHIRRNLVLVAETEEGKIAGYLLVLVRRRVPKLYSLGIDTTLRGRGVASMLLTSMMETLKARGFTRAVLEVRTDNAAAIALYDRFGFETRKTLKGFYKDGCDALFMEAVTA